MLQCVLTANFGGVFAYAGQTSAPHQWGVVQLHTNSTERMFPQCLHTMGVWSRSIRNNAERSLPLRRLVAEEATTR